MQKRTKTIGRGLVVTPEDFERQQLAADRMGLTWREFMREGARLLANEVLTSSAAERIPWDRLAALPIGARVLLRKFPDRAGGKWGTVVRGYRDGRKIVQVGSEHYVVPSEEWEVMR